MEWFQLSCHLGKKKENKNLGRSFIIQDCAAASSTQWKGSGCITALYLTFNVVVLRALCKMQFPSCIRIEEPKSQHVQLAGKAKKKQNSVFCSIFTACESHFWGNLETQIFPWTVVYFFLMKDKSLIIWVQAIWDVEDVPNQICCLLLWPAAPLPPSLHKPIPKCVRLWLFEVHITFFLILFSQPLGCLACFSASLFRKLLQPLIKSCKNNTWITFEEVCLWIRCQIQDGDV